LPLMVTYVLTRMRYLRRLVGLDDDHAARRV